MLGYVYGMDRTTRKTNSTIENLRHKLFWCLFVVLLALFLIILLTFDTMIINHYRMNARISLDFISHVFQQQTPHSETMPEFIKSDYLWAELDKNHHVSSVSFSNDNHFLEEETVKEYCVSLMAQDPPPKEGVLHGYPFLVKMSQRNPVIIFLDPSLLKRQTMNCIVLSSLIYLLIIIGLVFLCRKVASWLVKPSETAFEKQKQFMADCSHELKTPLAAIRANADLLEMKSEESKELQNIEDETESMAALINDLLTLSRLGEVDDSASFIPLDLATLVENVCMPLEALMEEKQQKLTLTMERDIKIKGNKRNLQKLLSVLLDNAGRNAPPATEIKVCLSQKEREPVISVTNRGKEIPVGEREKLFTRFYQQDPEHSADNNFGLGLAIAKGIADEHQASLKVDCDDGWISFIVTFPRSDEQ